MKAKLTATDRADPRAALAKYQKWQIILSAVAFVFLMLGMVLVKVAGPNVQSIGGAAGLVSFVAFYLFFKCRANIKALQSLPVIRTAPAAPAITISVQTEDDRPTRKAASAVARPLRGSSILRLVDDYVSVDIETTGFNSVECDIIEVAALRYRKGQEVDRFTSFISTDSALPADIVNLTGITDAMLVDAPALRDVLSRLMEFLSDDFIIGHNIAFDVNFIYDKCVSCGLMPPRNVMIDTLTLAKRVRPGLDDYKLPTVLAAFGVINAAPHRAGGDAAATAACYEAIKQYISENDLDKKKLLSGKSAITPYYAYIDISEIVPSKKRNDSNGPLCGRVVVATKEFRKMSRREVWQAIVDAGGSIANTVTEKTDCLVVGDMDFTAGYPHKKTTQLRKAEKYIKEGRPITIISEQEFLVMLAH